MLTSLNGNEILLLHSYNKGLKWTDGISSGVEEVISQQENFELTTQYMDSKKVESEDYFDELLDLYKKKFKSRAYKAVIVADNYAYDFMLRYRDEIFPNAPIVFCGVENFNASDIPSSLKKDVTGVVEYKDIRKNLQLMHDLFPELKLVYIISDDAYSSLVIQQQIINESREFKDKFKVIFDNQIDFDKIDQKIEALPPNSAILFTSFYKDMYGNYIPYHKLRNFFHRTKFPVFAVNKIHLGAGVIGGFMINPHEQGVLAAKKAFEIINGKEPSEILIDVPQGSYFFDNTILRRFGIALRNVPSESKIINEPKSFYEEHQKLVENVITLLPLLLVLLAFLIFNIFKRMSLEKELLRQNKLDYVLLNNIQSAVFWKSNDGIILGCNDLLCQITEKEKDEIIGQHVDALMPQVCRSTDPMADPLSSEEVQMKTKKGHIIDILVRRTYYTDEKNQAAGIVTILTDITEQKRIDTERKRHEQFVIQRSKQSEVGEMIASIAHQWKAPLVEISAIAQELLYKRRKKVLDEEDTTGFVDDIMTQVKYMSNTIDDFRKFIKPSSMKINFDVKDAIDKLLNVVKHSAKYNYITIQILQKSDEKLFAYGYPNEFKQCILNIINNAKDSILKKRETEETEGKIEIIIDSDAEFIYLSIVDDGTGIKTSQLESIFDPFMSTKESGDGFGLYMARLIIEDKMGGKIVAKSKIDGAHIFITLKKGAK